MDTSPESNWSSGTVIKDEVRLVRHQLSEHPQPSTPTFFTWNCSQLLFHMLTMPDVLMQAEPSGEAWAAAASECGSDENGYGSERSQDFYQVYSFSLPDHVCALSSGCIYYEAGLSPTLPQPDMLC